MYLSPSGNPAPLMTSEEVAVGLPTAFSQQTGDMDALQEELERLNKEIVEAHEDRARAAEYGIVLLEEKQALQTQNEEVNSLFDATKRELETAVDVSAYVLVISGGKLVLLGSVFSMCIVQFRCGTAVGVWVSMWEAVQVLLYTCRMHPCIRRVNIYM